MHVMLMTYGTRGDVQPFVALGRGLIDKGHRVTVGLHRGPDDLARRPVFELGAGQEDRGVAVVLDLHVDAHVRLLPGIGPGVKDVDAVGLD